nr:MAG TPA: hypothetical protein [Caudoviricetes sp.]
MLAIICISHTLFIFLFNLFDKNIIIFPFRTIVHPIWDRCVMRAMFFEFITQCGLHSHTLLLLIEFIANYIDVAIAYCNKQRLYAITKRFATQAESVIFVFNSTNRLLPVDCFHNIIFVNFNSIHIYQSCELTDGRRVNTNNTIIAHTAKAIYYVGSFLYPSSTSD